MKRKKAILEGIIIGLWCIEMFVAAFVSLGDIPRRAGIWSYGVMMLIQVACIWKGGWWLD